MRYLTINRCPQHGAYMISIDTDTGGTRLTEDKCCGRWHEIKRLPMSAKRLRDAAVEMECHADQMEQEGEEGQT